MESKRLTTSTIFRAACVADLLIAFIAYSVRAESPQMPFYALPRAASPEDYELTDAGLQGAKSYFRPESMMALGRRPRALIPSAFPFFNNEHNSHFRGAAQRMPSLASSQPASPAGKHPSIIRPNNGVVVQKRHFNPPKHFSTDQFSQHNKPLVLPQPPPSRQTRVIQTSRNSFGHYNNDGLLAGRSPLMARQLSPVMANVPATLSGLPFIPHDSAAAEPFDGGAPYFGYSPTLSRVSDGPTGPDGYPESYEMDLTGSGGFSPPFGATLSGFNPAGSNNGFPIFPPPQQQQQQRSGLYSPRSHSQFWPRSPNNFNFIDGESGIGGNNVVGPRDTSPAELNVEPQQNQLEIEANQQANDFNWGVNSLPPLNDNNNNGQFNQYPPRTLLNNRLNIPMQQVNGGFYSYFPRRAAPSIANEYYDNNGNFPQQQQQQYGGPVTYYDQGGKNIFVKRYGNSPLDQSYEVKYGVTFPATSNYYSPPPKEYIQLLGSLPSLSQPATVKVAAHLGRRNKKQQPRRKAFSQKSKHDAELPDVRQKLLHSSTVKVT